MPLSGFHEATRDWFVHAFGELESGRVRHLVNADPTGQWNAELALRKRDSLAGVRAYL